MTLFFSAQAIVTEPGGLKSSFNWENVGNDTPFLETCAVCVRHFMVPNTDLSHAVVVGLQRTS